MIRYVKHTDIDKQHWDACISNSENGLIYALSWYLDEACPEWEALIEDDYQAVMPLPVRRKFRIPYIYAAMFCQQLGVFGHSLKNELIEEFINHIPTKFRIVDIKFNEANQLLHLNYKSEQKVNQIIPIKKSYDLIQKAYNRNCKRNIKKAKYGNLKVVSVDNPLGFACFINEYLKDQATFLSQPDIDRLARITQAALDREKAEILAVTDSNGKACAMGSFLFHQNRVIFSVCASSDEGKRNQAMYLLVDHQIRKSAGKYEIFDFSGSVLKGVNYFNSTFGAIQKNYSLLQINRLPKIIRYLTGKNQD